MDAIRRRPAESSMKAGFTLVELSIVLVIIGLIIGGVLVGQDLISAAGVRAQISQIEKYNTAVNTFQGKYGYLPGDIPNTPAQQYGFAARGALAGQGDGNGVIEGNASCTPGGNVGFAENGGETSLFWTDLSTAQLIDGGFNNPYPNCPPSAPPNITGAGIALYLPTARIGQGNYIYVWSGGWGAASWPTAAPDGENYFGLSAINTLDEWEILSNAGLTVAEAYNIDTKIDDGLPQSGKVMAMYLDNSHGNVVEWAAGGGNMGAYNGFNDGPTTVATSGSATTCYDNGHVAGVQHYSMEQNNGAGINCGLSFQFQ